jgi:hypothetical protein
MLTWYNTHSMFVELGCSSLIDLAWEHGGEVDDHVVVLVGVELVVVAQRVCKLTLSSILVALLRLDLGLRDA